MTSTNAALAAGGILISATLSLLGFMFGVLGFELTVVALLTFIAQGTVLPTE